MAISEIGNVFRHIQVAFESGTVAGMTDRQLLERFAASRDQEAELAFAALVQRHGPMVLRVCGKILRNHQDAQDAFQATFLILARKVGTLWVQDSLGPWLHGVACRVAICAREAAARRRRHERRAAEISIPFVDGPDDEHDDLVAILHIQIGQLPGKYRVPIVLCDLEGETYESAARKLGCPVGTVKSRLARGRERLRNRILRHGTDLSPAVFLRKRSPSGPRTQPSRPCCSTQRLRSPGGFAWGPRQPNSYGRPSLTLRKECSG